VSQAIGPFDVVRELDPEARTVVLALVRRGSAASGHTALDESRLQRALAGDVPSFLAALAWNDARTALVGYVQALRGSGGWDVEHVIDPAIEPDLQPGGVERHHRDLAARLLESVIDALGIEDDTDVRLWVYRATDDDDRMATKLGLSLTRELRQMRRPLPLEENLREDAAGLAIRPFEVDRDEKAWLEVNNRAFAGHPDQGNWTLDDLRARFREPWFDPEGFLLHEVDGQLAGFCWTKVHAHAQPPMGEIYVIGVDPDHQQRQLGRALVVAGLEHLTRAGLTVGMLYVDATNTPAVSLYESLGFTVHHVDRVYRRLA
jgi:mycothiol synthase